MLPFKSVILSQPLEALQLIISKCWVMLWHSVAKVI